MPDPTDGNTPLTANTNTPRERPSPRPTRGRNVMFVESGESLAAIIAGVNDDESVNLLVLNSDATTFTRHNVRRVAALPPPEDPKERAAWAKEREQRWHWPVF